MVVTTTKLSEIPSLMKHKQIPRIYDDRNMMMEKERKKNTPNN